MSAPQHQESRYIRIKRFSGRPDRKRSFGRVVLGLLGRTILRVAGYFIGSFGSLIFIVGLANWSIPVTLAGAAVTMLGGWLFTV